MGYAKSMKPTKLSHEQFVDLSNAVRTAQVDGDSTVDIYVEQGGRSASFLEALPAYPFAEQSAFQASEPTVIRINMDAPRHSFLQKTWPKFNVDYAFASQKKMNNDIIDMVKNNQKSLDEIEGKQFLQKVDDDFVLNLVPPTEDHNVAMQQVKAAIQESRSTNIREFDALRRSVNKKQFVEASVSSNISALKNRIRYGGRIARNALNSLINLAQFGENKKTMIASGVLEECSTLLKRESTANDIRVLAGSVITLLTDLPVASTTNDVATGSYAHVNIVLPSPSRIYHA